MDNDKQTESKQGPIETAGSFPLQSGVMRYEGLSEEEDLKLKTILKKKISESTQEELAEALELLLNSVEYVNNKYLKSA